MSARLTARWPSISILVAAGCVLGATTVGCGSKTEEPAAPADTGIAIVDSTATDTKPVDTGTAAADSEVQYDVPGSLFDADIPDIPLEGGKSVKGCYDCTVDKCESQMKACDTDPRCRGVLLCVLTDCAGKFADQTCVIGCAFGFGVMSLTDPVVSKLQAVGACNQMQCTAACPTPPGDAGPADTKPADSASDTTTADTTAADSAAADSAATDSATADAADAMSDTKSDSETGAMMSNPFQIQKETYLPGKLQSVDPAVVDVLVNLSTSFGHPAVRQGAIDSLTH